MSTEDSHGDTNAGMTSGGVDDPTSSTVPTARAANETERIRLRNLLSIFRKKDDLDTAIYMTITPILEKMMTEDANIMTHSDVKDMIFTFPGTDSFLTLGFFNCVPFPFRMLRYVTVIHNVEPVPVDYISSFNLTIKDLENAHLHEQLWFLLFVGINCETILPVLEQHRFLKAELNAPLSSKGS